MMKLIAAAAPAMLLFAVSAGAAPPSTAPKARPMDDPFTFLEEIEGEKALDWARAENARSLPILESDTRFESFRSEALAILTSSDRLPAGQIHGGMVYNFWQDDAHVRGIWRRASLKSYRSGAPEWRTLIDYDALAAKEERNWVAEGRVCLAPTYRHCMIELSDGGSDAAYWREFDMQTLEFVDGGFAIPESKSSLSWIDENTLLVGLDAGEGSATASGYPRTASIWKRGEPIADARLVFEGRKEDVAVWPIVEQDGATPRIFAYQATTFFERIYHLIGADGSATALPLPKNADLDGVLDGRAIFSLREDWRYQDAAYAQGSVIAYDLASGAVERVFAANETQSIEDVEVGKTGLVIQYLENVSGKAGRLARSKKGEWIFTPIIMPGNGVVKIVSAGGGTDDAMLTFESLTDPQSLYFVSAKNKLAKIYETPAAYDSSDVVIEQHFAISSDGTKIPYFVMGKKEVLAQGNAPTIQYAYGGFLNATLPVYYEDPSRPQHGALAGKLWVSRGGVLVLSNIRGGSEFGAKWHQAGLKENRQKVFDDFIAISEDLISRGVTSPQKLGAIGRSNGGLLMGVVTNQRPDLYAAVVNGVPLFDMKNYTKLGAGASWVAEYGDPDTDDWAYMSKWSPYQNMKSGVEYPPVFYYTSTKDDRVHPGHARKAAARMHALGRDYFYYENMEGGHSGASNQDQLAYRIALEYAYFARRLMPEPGEN